ncbi:MAG: class beta-lactamase-related serine hydrolase [Verrucomicrobiaceae bacterium]|nr:class beta-lactamase-related serine hydrolase [Verrucomicrobiaceae bacterium]
MTASRRSFIKQFSALSLGSGLGSYSWTFAGQAITAGLPRSTPEAEGVDSKGIEAFIDAIAHSKHELHSFMMLRHGKVISEGWWAPYGPQYNHTMYSMSKSFTSTAVGLAVSEGKLSVEDLVVQFFPQDVPEPVSDHLASLKVKHLLTMSVGNETEPTPIVIKDEHWVRAFLERPITHAPGSVFMYNSTATYMLSAIVTKITGQTVLDFLKPRLFEPLGITGMTWETCPRGINTGGWGLSIPTEGLAKFGQLYLQKGKWNGRQLLPAPWVKEATTFKIQQPEPAKPNRPKEQNDWLQGYCYQFWRCQHGAFRGDGAFGQYTIVLPKQDAVIVMTGESHEMQGELDLVWQHLLPACQPKALPAVENQLSTNLAKLTLALPRGHPILATAASLSAKTFKLDANDLGLTSLNITFNDNLCTFTAMAGETPHAIVCGLGQWQRGETSLPGTPPRLIAGGAASVPSPSKIASAAAWKDAHTLEMLWRYYETSHHDAVTCQFDGDQVTVSFLNSIAALGGKTDARAPLIGRA